MATPSPILPSTKNEDLACRLADDAMVVVVEKHLEASECLDGQITLPRVDPSYPLYIVFTSGSTGTPKGVIISHQSFCSAIEYQQAALGFN